MAKDLSQTYFKAEAETKKKPQNKVWWALGGCGVQGGEARGVEACTCLQALSPTLTDTYGGLLPCPFRSCLMH